MAETSKKLERSAWPARVWRSFPSTRIFTFRMPGRLAERVWIRDATVSSSERTPERWPSAKAALRSITARPGSTR
jgi:hypothetical protein